MALVSYKCPNCGGSVVFDPKKQKFCCEFCMSEFTKEEMEAAAANGGQGQEALAKQLNAKLIYCESTREECLARAEERGVFAPEWAKYVREWWNDYEP